MPEIKSALAAVYRPGKTGGTASPAAVSICERQGRNLVQVSGSKTNFESVCERLAVILEGDIPSSFRRATSLGDRSVFRMGPERLWIVGPSNDDVLRKLNRATFGEEAIVTEVGHSRTVLRVAGPRSDLLLNRGLPIDLDPGVFPVNAFAQSAIHRMHVLVHRVDIAHALVFDTYVSRELAVSFWEWLTEAAAPLGCEIKKPDSYL